MGRNSRLRTAIRDKRALARLEDRKDLAKRAMTHAALFVVETQAATLPANPDLVKTFLDDLHIIAKFSAVGAFSVQALPAVDWEWLEKTATEVSRTALRKSPRLTVALAGLGLALSKSGSLDPLPPKTSKPSEPLEGTAP